MKKLVVLGLLLVSACFLLVYILQDKSKGQVAVNIGSQNIIAAVNANDTKGNSENSDEVETYINSIFAGEQTSIENRHKILGEIKDINWIKFDKLNKDRAFELMEWIGKQALSESELVSVMNATNGLDAAYTESYCALLGNLCKKDEKAFIKAASMLEGEKLETVCAFTAYYLGYSSNESYTKGLKEHLKTYGSNTREKQAAQTLLKAIETGIQ